jgi:5-(carboxyamino)imidazole ribonucleotide mutase
MGSSSDRSVMAEAAAVLDELGVPCRMRVVSAHRTPDDMLAYGHAAAGRGVKVVIAGAGGAAHLPGMLAAVTVLPVIGVPVGLSHLRGVDSLLSIVQMPAGVPVATVGIDAARNAGLLAARILATSDARLTQRLQGYAAGLVDKARGQDRDLQAEAVPGT